MLEVSCKALSFDEVAVNDIPAYRSLHVCNTTNAPISVSISSSSPLVRSQLSNENYDAIQRVGLRDFLSVYNEAFDLVGAIDSFELTPHEEKEIVVSFRAESGSFAHLLSGAQAVPFNGVLQLTAISTIAGAVPSTNGATVALSGSSGDLAAVNDLTSSTDDAAAAALPSVETVSLPFRASVYVSLLKVSSTEIQVAMAPNKTQVVDFVITNTSCQPVLFLIRDQAMPLKGLDVALYEADKFEDPKLGHRILLDSYASMTFSLMLRSSGVNANAQAHYRTVLQCDNLRDSRNTLFIHVSVSVGNESQGDILAVPDSSVEFGDVYRGAKAFAQLRLQNIDGREDAVVRLGDAGRRKYDGKFSLMKGDTVVDELIIPAQKGNPATAVTLMYQPSHDAESKEVAKKKFDVELFAQVAGRASTQRVVVRCAATLYTSSIVVSQRSVNFGDCQVGQSKRYTLHIENHSPLQGKIVVQLRSKIIQIEGVLRSTKSAGREVREEFTIAPSASLPLTLKITPQRVNPMYRKQLTIINASNTAEDRQVINIEANNMAPLDTKLHDELYSWKCDLSSSISGGNNNSSSSMESSGARRGQSTLWAISNVPLLIPYSVQSRVDRSIVLNLRSTSPEIEVFYCVDPTVCEQLSAISSQLRRFCLFGEGEDSSYLTNDSAEQLFKTREELIALLSVTSRNITSSIVLEPKASLKAYALIIRTACPTEPLTKEDGISIAVDGIDAPRFVRLSYRLCGTTFELNGQKTKNFGEVNIGVKKTTKLPIVNRCNSFLFLQLSKSRSVTAEHIRMEHSDKQFIYLTIRPYASREIELTLYPGIKGVFQEKIRVTNILNVQNSITMTLKAVVTKADTFEISPDSWTFEMMVPPSASAAALMHSSASSTSAAVTTDDSAGGASGNGVSNSRVGAKFTVANMSSTRRQIIARVELNSAVATSGVSQTSPYLTFPGVKVAVQLDMTLTGAASVSTRKLEEQIEKLEQKLKIYERKKKTEKAENARRKIEAFRLALRGEEVDLSAIEAAQSGAQGMADHDLSESEDEGSNSTLQALRNKSQQSDLAQLLRREGVALPSMGSGESVMITVFLVCKRIVEETLPVTQSQTINFLFYEARDQEANRIIPIDIILMRTPGDTFPVAIPAALDAPATAAALPATGTLAIAGPVKSEGASKAASSTPLSADYDPGALPSASSRGAPGALGNTGATPVRAQLSRPAPTIRLRTLGAQVNSGGGRLHSTFMGHPLLVLRNCIVNDQTEFTFLVEADSDTTIVVLEPRRCGGSVPEVLDARFKLFPRNGHVRQREPLRIVVECTARSVGPQKYFIPVKNIRNAADVRYLTVEMNPTEEVDMVTTEPKELLFRDVLTPCAPSQLQSQVVMIRSRFPFPHALVVRTNKPSQIALFEDASCTVPLLHPIRRIFVRETVRVYVQLRPGARYTDPRARHIHAGVLVEALAPNPAASSAAFCVIGKAVLRAVAFVGSGLIEVPQRSLDLGCVPAAQHYAKAQLVVRNTSHSFELRVGLAPSSPLVAVADDVVKGEDMLLAPLQEHVVSLVLHLPAPGLSQEYVDVVNHSSAQETIRVFLSALRLHEGIVQVEPAVNTTLAFPMAAVVRGDGREDLHLHQPVSCSVRMANYHSNREVVLASTANVQSARELPLWFHTADEEARVRSSVEEAQRLASEAADDDAAAAAAAAADGSRPGTTAPTSTPTSAQLPLSSTYVRGRVELPANRAEVVMWTLTSLPPLTAAEVEAVLQHQLVTITATMQVCVTYTAHSAKSTAAASGGWQTHATPRSHNNRDRGPAVGQCVLLVPVMLSLAMSEGRAEPAVVNLGLVAKPASQPASPVSTVIDSSSDDENATEADEASVASGGQNEEAVLAARVRRRRRVRLAQLRRPGNYQQFSSYGTKSGLQHAAGTDLVVAFRLVNLSPVMPLPLKVECPPVIRFSQTRLTIAPGASVSVDATLNLKLITTQGPFRYEAFFVNEWNPENDMAVCVTGQHYWKVFKILRTDTDEELSDAVNLAPLRIEPSSLAPLSELKLAFVATEPDVAFDLRVQPNPQLEGLLELLLLHYDATSAATHLSFRSDAPTAPQLNAPTSALAGGGAAAAGAGAAPPIAAAAHLTSSISGTPQTAGAAAVVGEEAGSPALTATVHQTSAATHGGAGVAALPSTATGGTSAPSLAAATTTTTAAAAGAAVSSVSASAKTTRKPGAGGTTTGSSAATAPSTRSQRLRLRCMPRSGDLASLVAVFYGLRKSRAAGTAAAAGTDGSSSAAAKASGGGDGTATAPAAAAAGGTGPGVAASLWTYDRAAELERRSAAMVSNNVWLGTVWVANPFTEDEEVQVYSTLSQFRTFTASSKLTLRPCRISVDGARGGTTADGARVVQVGYVGELTITNDFDAYVAEISVVVLVSDRLGVPLEIDVRGGTRGVAAAAPAVDSATTLAAAPGTAGSATPAPGEPAEDGSGAPPPAQSVATSFVAAVRVEGGPPVSRPHTIQLGPHEAAVITVAIRPAEPAVAGHFSLTSLEQCVSVAIVDEGVPFSHHVCRTSVVTPADGVEALPTVTLSATPGTALAGAVAEAREGGDVGQQPCSTPSPQQQQQQQQSTTTGAAAAVPLSPGSAGTSATATPAPSLAATTAEHSPEQPLSHLSRRSSTHTSHVAGDEAGPQLPPAVAVEPSAAAPAGSADDTVVDARAAGEDTASPAPRGSGVAEGEPEEGAAAAASSAASVQPPDTAAVAAPRRWTLSLRNCDPLPGCGGAYVVNFSVSRDDTYDANILITNHRSSAAVRYSVQVVSQSPQVWLLLTATAGVLEAGETHPLRLQVLSSEVGSFVGYVAITNLQDTREVMYLRLNAEVFVPGAAEGLFDVIAMNGGNRLASAGAVHTVDMGALYGPGTTRALIALELVNRGSVALEFPASVVHPMRQELRPIPQSVWYGNAVTTSSHHRRRNARASSGAAADAQRSAQTTGGGSGAAEGGGTWTPQHVSSTQSPSPAATSTAALAETALQPYELAGQRGAHHHHHHHQHHAHHRRGGGAAAPTATTAFEGKLVVCHIHNVPARAGQKYFVVDPRSPLRLAFLLSCHALRDIPDGYGVFGQADVVFKCKQARDAQFTFTVKFEAYKPTFAVATEYDMDAAELAQADAAPDTQTPEAMPSAGVSLASLPSTTAPPRPPRAAATPSRWAEAVVAVTNLSRTHTQVFVLFTQSEVLTLALAPAADSAAGSSSRGVGEVTQDPPPGSQLLPALQATTSGGGEDGAGGAALPAAPAVEVSVPPLSVGSFVVRLDRLRAEALLNFDKDEAALARPALCEHAFLYNKGNPRERVRLLFRQYPIAAASSPRHRGGHEVSAHAMRPLSPNSSDAKPVRGSGSQHFSDRHILSFAQRFSAVLTSLADRLPFVARAEDSADGAIGVGGGGVGSSSHGLSDAQSGGGGGGAAVGDYAKATRAVAPHHAASGGSTPMPSHARGAGGPHHHHPAHAGVDGSGPGRGGSRHRRRRGVGAAAAVLYGSRLDSDDDASSSSAGSSSADSRSSSVTTTSTDGSVDSEAAGTHTTVDDADRTLNSTLTEESGGGPLARALRDVRDESVDGEGAAVSRVSGLAAGSSVGRLMGSHGEAGDGDGRQQRQRQQTPSATAQRIRLRSGENSADALQRSPAAPPSLFTAATMTAAGSSVTAPSTTRSSADQRASEEARWYDALSVLHDLLVELTWLCDELLFYAILLRNSRHVEACGAFLVAAVVQHPVMSAWRRRRGSASRAREYEIFGRFLDTVDVLPRTSGSIS